MKIGEAHFPSLAVLLKALEDAKEDGDGGLAKSNVLLRAELSSMKKQLATAIDDKNAMQTRLESTRKQVSVASVLRLMPMCILLPARSKSCGMRTKT